MTSPGSSPRGGWFWASVVVGWAAIGFGVRGALDLHATFGFARWFVGLAIVHDAVIAPAAFAVAWLAGRVLPATWVIPVRIGLASSALLLAFAWPLVRGYGERDTNPSALPLDYGRNVVVLLVAIWVGVAVAVVIDAARRRPPRTREGVS